MQSDGPKSPSRFPVPELPRENCRKLHFGAELIREQTSALFSLQVKIIDDGVPRFWEHEQHVVWFTGHTSARTRHHMPAAAATTTSRLSFDFQRPFWPDFELN